MKTEIETLRIAILDVFKQFEEDMKFNQEPEFKVGQWKMIINVGALCDTHPIGEKYPEFKKNLEPDSTLPVRVIDLVSDNYPDMVIVEQNGNVFVFSNQDAFRPATEQEIESHLRKICDETYIGKKVECLSIIKDVAEIGDFSDYDFESDIMVYKKRSSNLDIYVYEKGKFAEVIESKKALPKTREEFHLFLIEWLNSDYLTVRDGVNIFLENYKD